MGRMLIDDHHTVAGLGNNVGFVHLRPGSSKRQRRFFYLDRDIMRACVGRRDRKFREPFLVQW